MSNWKSIVAMASNGIIGINGELPWHLPEDLKWFKKCTLGQVVVMGRKTFDFFGSRPLPKRQTIVISRQENLNLPDGVLLFKGINELREFKTDKEIWICGGCEIYKQTLSECSDFYLTYIKKEYSGDTTFPDFSQYFKEYEIIREEEEFEIRHYKRIKQT